MLSLAAVTSTPRRRSNILNFDNWVKITGPGHSAKTQSLVFSNCDIDVKCYSQYPYYTRFSSVLKVAYFCIILEFCFH